MGKNFQINIYILQFLQLIQILLSSVIGIVLFNKNIKDKLMGPTYLDLPFSAKTLAFYSTFFPCIPMKSKNFTTLV
jgi:hypothetical protein